MAFLLESGIFLLMGLQLKTLLDQDAAAGLSDGQAVGIGLAAAALALALRIMFIGPLVAVLRRDADRAAAARPELEKIHRRVTDPEVSHRFSARRMERLAPHLARTMGDVDFFVSESFGWRGGVVLAWSGMRGVITVAAAQSLPDDTPARPEVVLIAFVVAGTTLLVQGLTLPSVIRALKIPGDDPAADRPSTPTCSPNWRRRAEEVLADPGLSRPGGRPYDGDVLDRVREAALARASLAEAAEPDTVSPREQYRHLMLRILAAERAELLAARSAGRYRSRTLTRAQRALDLMEATLQQIPDLADTESSSRKRHGSGAERSRYSQPACIWRSDQTSARLATVSCSLPQRCSGPAAIAVSWVRQARSSSTAVMTAVGASWPTATMPCCGIRQARASPSTSASAAPSDAVLIRPPVSVKRGMSG